jgi:hypothetical protein
VSYWFIQTFPQNKAVWSNFGPTYLALSVKHVSLHLGTCHEQIKVEGLTSNICFGVTENYDSAFSNTMYNFAYKSQYHNSAVYCRFNSVVGTHGYLNLNKYK